MTGDLQILAVLRTDRAAMVFRSALDGVVYRFRLAWNTRWPGWILDVSASDGTPIVLGIPVVTGVALLGAFDDKRLPAGQIFARDTSHSGETPGRHDWRGRVQLVYRPRSVVSSAVGTDDEVL